MRDEIYLSWNGFIKRWVEPIRRDNMDDEESASMRKEAREIGKAAWDSGGVPFMLQLHAIVPNVMYFPRVVELLWSGIGNSDDINERWNA